MPNKLGDIVFNVLFLFKPQTKGLGLNIYFEFKIIVNLLSKRISSVIVAKIREFSLSIIWKNISLLYMKNFTN